MYAAIAGLTGHPEPSKPNSDEAPTGCVSSGVVVSELTASYCRAFGLGLLATVDWDGCWEVALGVERTCVVVGVVACDFARGLVRGAGR